jgi:hypothetical protein
MGCSASIARYPAKIPHSFESLKILAFYTILLRTPLIACKAFLQALLSGFQRVVCRLALPSNRWLKRPTPNPSRRFQLCASSSASLASWPASSWLVADPLVRLPGVAARCLRPGVGKYCKITSNASLATVARVPRESR